MGDVTRAGGGLAFTAYDVTILEGRAIVGHAGGYIVTSAGLGSGSSLVNGFSFTLDFCSCLSCEPVQEA
jgi:hypothetical protein